jgi:hypothetical protein
MPQSFATGLLGIAENVPFLLGGYGLLGLRHVNDLQCGWLRRTFPNPTVGGFET